MATKKATTALEMPENEDAKLEQEAEKLEKLAETEQPVKSEWDEEIEMIVPRKPKGEEKYYYICVNDRRFQVPADGKMQKLPKPIALVLMDTLEAEQKADDFADNIPNEDVTTAFQLS